jgi:tetratricopeptide (TPR) repeat protein
VRRAVALFIVTLAAGCGGEGAEARREYLSSLELSKTGRPLEEQLVHADRAVRLAPTSATYLEKRADLLFGLRRLPEARADYDRAVALADRPYLRFARADLLCALGELDAALTDLDRAIAEQPVNTQFYPRRALARLTVGRVADARADVDHAMSQSRGAAEERYARGAVLLMEGRPADAIADFDFAAANAGDPSHGALPRTVRLLAYAALGKPDPGAAEFTKLTPGAVERWPEIGYRYWLHPRGCSNGFIGAQAGDLVARAESMLAGSQSLR